jgi:hypothetical protein
VHMRRNRLGGACSHDAIDGWCFRGPPGSGRGTGNWRDGRCTRRLARCGRNALSWAVEMWRILWFLRAVALGVLVAGLCLLLAHAAGASEAPKGATMWSVMDGGAAPCGLETRLANGGGLRLIVDHEAAFLVAHHPGWMLPAGQADVVVRMGQDAFVGTATVTDSSTLVVEGLTSDFLSRFVEASTMTADFGGVQWTVGLHVPKHAAWALAACAGEPRRRLAT